MNCTEVKAVLGAHLDCELDPERSSSIENHLSECSACSGEFDAIKMIRTTVRERATYFEPPASLAEGLARRFESNASPVVRGLMPAKAPRSNAALGLAALAGAAISVLAMTVLPLLIERTSGSHIEEEVFSAHARSLLADHLTDVASSDRHTVKPWFQGRVDYSLSVVSFDADGFVLKGGRLDYLDGRPVAALVYQIRQHLVNVFMWPVDRSSDEAPEAVHRRGFNAEHWTRNGMRSWIVSDVDPKDVHRLAELIRSN